MLLDGNLETLQAGSNYRFSGTKIQALGASEYTLATIVIDTSDSVESFKDQLEKALKIVFKACEKSPRKENLLLRVTTFSSTLSEMHGFKMLSTIKESDYNNAIQVGGLTALYDAMDEAIQATTTYGKQLISNDFLANAIIVVITDGQNNRGNIQEPGPVKKSLEAARKSENLESINVILVGVTNDDQSLDHYLKMVKDEAGVTQYLSIGTATPGKVAKLAEFVSQSISSTSSALGTGSPSQPLPTPNGFNF